MSARRSPVTALAVAGCLATMALTGCGSDTGSTSSRAADDTNSEGATTTAVLGADGRPLVGATQAAKPAEGDGAQPEGDGAVAVPANQASIQRADQLVQCLTRQGREATYESATAYEMPTTEMTAALRAGTGGTVVEVEPSRESDGEEGPTIEVFLLGDERRARAFAELVSDPDNEDLFAEETGERDFETGHRETTYPDIKRAGSAVVVASDFLIGDEEELFARTCGLGELQDE